jgi:hypothetical protein
MQKVRNVLKYRALLTLLAIVMVWGSLTFMLVPDANACSPTTTEITYYTNASLTVECGYKIIACHCGGTFSSGCVTAFRTTDVTSCE